MYILYKDNSFILLTIYEKDKSKPKLTEWVMLTLSIFKLYYICNI